MNIANLTLPRLLANNPLRGRSLLSIKDLTVEEADSLLFAASKLKARRAIPRGSDEFRTALAGRHLAIISQKPSLRTRTTFDIGMTELGGHAVLLGPEIGFGERETPADIGRNLGRWVHAIAARVYSQSDLEELSRASGVPVINALSDYEHPCQALADFLTLRERWGTLRGRKLAFIGDGNNVLHSLLLLAARQGIQMVAACPDGYGPDEALVTYAEEACSETGASVRVVDDVQEAARDADALYTDTWVSMGQEDEAWQRKKAFHGYQINRDLLSLAKPGALVMHCLPAHRGEEITDEVMDGPQSVILDQAENRLHAQKAVLLLALHSGPAAGTGA